MTNERFFNDKPSRIFNGLSYLYVVVARMSGKGDRPRPMKDRKKFEENFDRIFGKRKEKKDDKKNNR
jgi:hypothetical protein